MHACGPRREGATHAGLPPRAAARWPAPTHPPPHRTRCAHCLRAVFPPQQWDLSGVQVGAEFFPGDQAGQNLTITMAGGTCGQTGVPGHAVKVRFQQVVAP